MLFFFICKHLQALKRSWKIFHGGPGKVLDVFVGKRVPGNPVNWNNYNIQSGLLIDAGVLLLYQISLLDFKTSEFVSIHSKPIRDLAFHSRTSDATLLSCSMDKTLKLTGLQSNSTLQRLVSIEL